SYGTPPLTDFVDVFERQVAGHNGDRNPELADHLAGQHRDQGPRSFRSRIGTQDQNGDTRLLLDQLQELVAADPLANIEDRHRPGPFIYPLRPPLPHLLAPAPP